MSFFSQIMEQWSAARPRLGGAAALLLLGLFFFSPSFVFASDPSSSEEMVIDLVAENICTSNNSLGNVSDRLLSTGSYFDTTYVTSGGTSYYQLSLTPFYGSTTSFTKSIFWVNNTWGTFVQMGAFNSMDTLIYGWSQKSSISNVSGTGGIISGQQQVSTASFSNSYSLNNLCSIGTKKLYFRWGDKLSTTLSYVLPPSFTPIIKNFYGTTSLPSDMLGGQPIIAAAQIVQTDASTYKLTKFDLAFTSTGSCFAGRDAFAVRYAVGPSPVQLKDFFAIATSPLYATGSVASSVSNLKTFYSPGTYPAIKTPLLSFSGSITPLGSPITGGVISPPSFWIETFDSYANTWKTQFLVFSASDEISTYPSLIFSAYPMNCYNSASGGIIFGTGSSATGSSATGGTISFQDFTSVVAPFSDCPFIDTVSCSIWSSTQGVSATVQSKIITALNNIPIFGFFSNLFQLSEGTAYCPEGIQSGGVVSSPCFIFHFQNEKSLFDVILQMGVLMTLLFFLIDFFRK